MEIKIKENLRSSAFWISAAAFILLMLHTFGVTVIDARYNQVFNAILGLLTVLGLFNAPQVVANTPVSTQTSTVIEQPAIDTTIQKTPDAAAAATEATTAIPVTKVATIIYTKEDGTPLQEVPPTV